MRNSVVLAVLSTLGLAAAAAQNYTINTGSISPATRANWCNAEYNTCSKLCDNSPKANSCDPDDLTYSCLCSNNSAPGLEYYLQTMPTFICQEAFSECIANNAGDSIAQGKCKTSIQANCGTLDPANYTAAADSTSSSASSTATGKAASSSAASTATAATTSSTNGAVPTALAHFGTGAAAVAVGVFAYLL